MTQGFYVVIPARWASTRLPEKPLLDIAGKPMVQHVWERASASGAERVIVATDDARIQSACTAFGAECVLTSAQHASGTDRLAEVADRLGLPEGAILVNVQGDEPLIPPGVINQVAANLARHPEADIATLSEAISSLDDLLNPNVVKVVSDRAGLALTFSRAPLPWAREAFATAEKSWLDSRLYQRHIGIYAYRVGFLRRFVEWGPCELEALEALEQLRALWNGVRIHVAEAEVGIPGGVDTPADLERVRAFLGGA